MCEGGGKSERRILAIENDKFCAIFPALQLQPILRGSEEDLIYVTLSGACMHASRRAHVKISCKLRTYCQMKNNQSVFLFKIRVNSGKVRMFPNCKSFFIYDIFNVCRYAE